MTLGPVSDIQHDFGGCSVDRAVNVNAPPSAASTSTINKIKSSMRCLVIVKLVASHVLRAPSTPTLTSTT